MSHWTSFSFKMFVSDESIHGKPDTLDTFAPWNPRQSCILDSMPWIPDSRYCSPDSNPKLYSGFPELYSGIQSPEIPDSKQNFLDSGISPQAKISPSPESWFPYMERILPLGCRPSDQCKAIPLLASLIVNRSPLSVKSIPGFVFPFKTNAHHSILCLDYNSLR